MEKQLILSKDAPEPIGAYSQAIKFGDLLFISGQLPIDNLSGELIFGSIKDETRRTMENIGAILKEAKMDFSNVLKVSILLKDINDFEKVNSIYCQYFENTIPPARECYQVACLPKNANIEISVIAGA